MELLMNMYMFIIGIVFGSFFNVCIFRIPKNQSISYPSSHCPKCNTKLKSRDLIPIVSYFMNQKRCRYCKNKISSRYAIVEFLTGATFLLIYNTYFLNLRTIYYLVLISLLIIITFIDIDHYIIPKSLVIIGFLFAIIFNLIFNIIMIKESLLGGIICGGVILLLVYIIEFILKKEVMGGGDIKLFAMIGLFLGIKNSLVVVLLSAYLGAGYGIISILYNKVKKHEYNPIIPYGPFISIASFMVILWGNKIIEWYFNLMI